jgi:hypothetical protein
VKWVGRRAQEVTAQRDEHLDAPLAHTLDGLDGVGAVLGGRREVELGAQRLHELVAHLFPDADGAVALHVAVPAHRAQPGAAATDLSAHQREVGDGLHVGDAVLVLGDAHGPAADHPLRGQRDVGRLADQVARHAALGQDHVPLRGVEIEHEGVPPLGVVIDEIVCQPQPAARAVGVQHLFHDAL